MTSAEQSYIKASWMNVSLLWIIFFVFFVIFVVATPFVLDKKAMDTLAIYALGSGTLTSLVAMFLSLNAAGQTMSVLGNYFMTRPVTRRFIYWGNCGRGTAFVLLLVGANSAMGFCVAWVRVIRSHGAESLDPVKIVQLLTYEISIALLVYITCFSAAMAMRKGVAIALMVGMAAAAGNVPIAYSIQMFSSAESAAMLAVVIAYSVAVSFIAERMFSRREI